LLRVAETYLRFFSGSTPWIDKGLLILWFAREYIDLPTVQMVV